ncbi:M23 family metallopeptidase [Sphingomonas sp. GCM10030256]|uniref:M23 family metallopeptidase n=1 Tax=Sphingomonas sp. GCM10030256 TaxID=3273427 RepID=UPI0036133BE9
MARRFSIVGNLIVFGIVALGAWLVWTNAFRTAAPPSAPVGALVDAAEKVGFDPARQAPRAGEISVRDLQVGPRGLAVPVDRVHPRQLSDTYTQSRGGGARVHNAIDIMAERGRPVVAAAPGIVEKLFYSQGGGGITVYVRSPDRRWMYYYAHLDAYAPGLREGQRVERGTALGTVGISGNANPSGPHLHFAINRMDPREKWYQGEPVNPYPLLAGNRASR